MSGEGSSPSQHEQQVNFIAHLYQNLDEVFTIKMPSYVKSAHTAIFSGPTGCGKTKRVLDLIEHEYRHHFENIVILCPTLH